MPTDLAIRYYCRSQGRFENGLPARHWMIPNRIALIWLPALTITFRQKPAIPSNFLRILRGNLSWRLLLY